MSKLRNATIAAVCAVGATAVMITPASAAGTGKATYNCGIYGSSVAVDFIRTTTGALTVKASLPFIVPPGGTIPINGITGTLQPPPSPPYPIVVKNATAMPPGIYSSITLNAASSPAMSGPPATIKIVVGPPPTPPVTVTCTLKTSPVPTGWPI